LAPANISMISYGSSSLDLSDSATYPKLFRVVTSDAIQSHAMVDLIKHDQFTKPAILYMNNAYGIGFATAFEQFVSANGMTNCLKESFSEDLASAEASTLVSAVKASNCDVVVLASYCSNRKKLLNQITLIVVKTNNTLQHFSHK
jgi:ABC-type branched-subunit amino acid transport system substrate-binding protein